MSARALIEAADDDDDDLPLGAPDPKDAPVAVTIRISGDGASRFREFMQGLAKVCNVGSSREIAIVDPATDDERALTWAFDGDGNTRIEVDDARD